MVQPNDDRGFAKVTGVGPYQRSRDAVRYAEHGFRVLPGAAWTADRGWVSDGEVAESVGPSVPRTYATSDVDAVRKWFDPLGNKSASGLITAAPGRYDIISVLAGVGKLARQHHRFRSNRTPVIFRPDIRREFFLVSPRGGRDGGPLNRDIPEDIAGYLKADSWVLAPPERVGPKPSDHVGWIVDPHSTGYRFGDFVAISTAIIVAAESARRAVEGPDR